MKGGKRRALVCLMGIGIFLTFGPTLKARINDKREAVKFSIPTTKSMSFLPFEFASKKGFYEKEGLNLDLIIVRSVISIAGLKAGDLDYVGIIGDILRAAALGVPFKVIAAFDEKPSYFMVTRPEIKAGKDLRGRHIGVGSIGDSTYFAARKVLEHYGLNPDKDALLTSTPPGMQLVTMMAGSVDAAIMWVPYTIMAKKKGFNILVYVGDLLPLAGTGLSTTDSKIKENPEQVKKVLRGSLKSHLRLKTDREEAVEFMIKEWGIDRELATITYNDGNVRRTPAGLPSDKAIQVHLDILKEQGLIKGVIPVSQVANFILLKEVQKELGVGQ